MKTWVGLCLAALALSAQAAPLADWSVYRQGEALELAVDLASIWREDGLIHFVNQERFAERQYEKGYDVNFHIRRTTGYADCAKYRYAFVSSAYYTASNRHVWSTLYPLPRYSWTWQPVYENSVADAMMRVVCAAGKTASSKKSNRP
ncbi:surface-adhesin E family protein [Pseudogulbenkiania ferrooxidans]|uniref:Surface-adhesin protein E-like domain-containing protein n=1 Tax=Pseudogulbenkiania ferrooxidans 2002 TaxID=279714 RepID=B9Z1H6_9NEIS|nr:surface-adhesin E family protein [Pseudogulbenkiania ferrooxidans]EEG09271.1 conserved hypothetical protein [Pseudogulbenkiania ferrooxidans 2002]